MDNALLLGKRYSAANLKPVRLLSTRGKKTRDQIIREISAGTMVMEETPCPCGEELSETLAEKDCFGLPLKTVICPACGLIRTNPRPTAETFAAFYQKHMFRDLYSRRDFRERENDNDYMVGEEVRGRQILCRLRPFLPKNAKLTILEIGCGAGGILLPFLKEGHNCIGVDLDNRFAKRIRSLGMEFLNGRLNDFPALNDIDLLITNHYLEHVSDLNAELDDYTVRLKPSSGLLFVGVPGLRSLAFQEQNDFLQLIQFAHTFIYDLPTLDITLGRFGFRREFGNDNIDAIFRNAMLPQTPPSHEQVEHYIADTKAFLKRIERTRKIREPYNLFSRHAYNILGANRLRVIKKWLKPFRNRRLELTSAVPQINKTGSPQMIIELNPISKTIAEESLHSHDGLAAKFSTIILCANDSRTIEEIAGKTGWPAETVRHVLEKYKAKGDSFLRPRPKTKKTLFKNRLFTTYEGAEWQYYKGALLISSSETCQATMEEIKQLIPNPAGKRILDVGAGEGAQAMMLRDMGFSLECIDVEDLRYVPLDIPFRRIDADKGLADSLGCGQYDLIMAIEVVGCLREPFKFFEEAFKLLRPGGYFLITMNNITNFVSRATFATEGTFSNYPKGEVVFEHRPSIVPLPWFVYKRMFRAVGFEDIKTKETAPMSIVCLQSWKHLLHSIVRLIMYILSLKSPSDPRVGKSVLVRGRKPLADKN